MQRINFTQDTLNTLKRSARCSFANAVYKLTMKAQQGLKCDDLFKKSVLMNEVNKLLCKYKLDTCISFHPALEAGISSWYFGVGDISPYIWEIYLTINDVVTLIGEGTNPAEIVIDINANTETTGVSAELSEDGYYMTVYSPPGCFVKADLIRNATNPGSVPQTLITFVAGKCPQEETCVDYTEEELNCITPQDLQLLFEFTHKYKETLAKSTKRITSPSTSSSSPSPSDCCNWGSIGGSIGNQSDLITYLANIQKNYISIDNEGTEITNDVKSINFTGSGVNATYSGSGNVTVDIPGGGGGFECADLEGCNISLLTNDAGYITEALTYTVNNGLTEDPANNFKLGGTLIEDTTITQDGYLMRFEGSAAAKEDFLVTIDKVGGTGSGLYINSDKLGAVIDSDDTGLNITSLNAPIIAIGTGASSLYVLNNIANSQVNLLNLYKSINTTSDVNSGVYISMNPGTDSGGSNIQSSDISCLIVNATQPNVQSKLVLNPQGAGTVLYGSALEAYGSGKLQLPAYGQTPANFSGTPAYLLGVDANGDVVETTVSGGSQTLADTLALGNTSGANDIQFDATQGLLFDNAARLREGTIDAGLGGTKGVAQICAVGYELKWEAGRLYVMDGNGLFIRQSLYNFTTTPTATDDDSKGYMVGSLWTLDDGTVYVCSDATTGAAVWAIGGIPTLQQVTDAGATTTVGLTVDNGTESVVIKHDKIKIVNALGADAVITSPTLATTTNFELPNKAGGTETFAMMSDVADINTNAVDRITVKLSESINKGQAVYISGANGTNILVSKADNTTEATSSKTLGLLETTGATNAIVNVVTNGLLDGLDTSAATAVGDAVWLGTSGNLLFGLASKPYAPAHLVYIGVVSRKSATVGEIIVNIQNGFELKEIHDVSAQTPANKDGLFYNTSTSLWEARQVVTADISNFVENLSLQDGGSSIAATTYTLELYAAYAYTINQLKIISASGTCTVAVKINGVDVTGISAVAVSSTIATGTASAANTVAIGDKVTLVTTLNSALTNLQASLKTTRI